MSDSTEYPDPTQADLASPQFEAVWRAIKGWDISRGDETSYPFLSQSVGGDQELARSGRRLYSGATGNDVMHILNALRRKT
jgi:hypothetical protein